MNAVAMIMWAIHFEQKYTFFIIFTSKILRSIGTEAKWIEQRLLVEIAINSPKFVGFPKFDQVFYGFTYLTSLAALN